MKFLVDAQLPPRLARTLTGLGHQSWHVGELGPLDASDSAVWALARANTCAIISKDSDFLRLSVGVADPVPLLLLRVGNCGRDQIIAIVCAKLPAIVAAFAAGETIVELR